MSNVETIRLVLLGGHVDGQELEVRDPGPRVMVPALRGYSLMAADPVDLEAPAVTALAYDLVLVDGWPSIDDQGRRRYRLAGGW